MADVTATVTPRDCATFSCTVPPFEAFAGQRSNCKHHATRSRRSVQVLAEGSADGSELQSITPIELRRLCRYPSNDLDAIPQDVYPLDMVPMGNYALSVRWSDGHQSLIPYASFVEGYK